MDNKYSFGLVEVTCEGYSYPEDPFILKGSCGVRNTVGLIKKETIRYIPFHVHLSAGIHDWLCTNTKWRAVFWRSTWICSWLQSWQVKLSTGTNLYFLFRCSWATYPAFFSFCVFSSKKGGSGFSLSFWIVILVIALVVYMTYCRNPRVATDDRPPPYAEHDANQPPPYGFRPEFTDHQQSGSHYQSGPRYKPPGIY